MLCAASPWQSAQDLLALPALAFQSTSPSSTQNVAGVALVERDLGGEEGRAECEQQKRRVGKGAKRRAHAADTAVGTLRFAHPTGPCLFHSTVIFAEPVSWKPLSPVHSNSIVPLSVATVWKLTNGLAAIAGNRSVRKISSPL